MVPCLICELLGDELVEVPDSRRSVAAAPVQLLPLLAGSAGEGRRDMDPYGDALLGEEDHATREGLQDAEREGHGGAPQRRRRRGGGEQRGGAAPGGGSEDGPQSHGARVGVFGGVGGAWVLLFCSWKKYRVGVTRGGW